MFAVKLVLNITLIISLSVIYNFITSIRNKYGRREQLVTGILFGIICIAGMSIPVVLAPGLIFDGRSIIISIAALFTGPLSGITAALIAISYRISLGGPGTLMGVLVITESLAAGTLFHYLKKNNSWVIKIPGLLLFGFIVHVLMVLLTYTLPADLRTTALITIALPVLSLYPAATVIVAGILLEQDKKRRNIRKMESIVNILSFEPLNIKDFLEKALAEAIELSDSKNGYICIYKKENEEFAVKAVSDDLKKCLLLNLKDNSFIKNNRLLEKIASDKKSITVNNIRKSFLSKENSSDKTFSCKRVMAVPSLSSGEIFCVIVLTDKASDYDEVDAAHISILLENIRKSYQNISYRKKLEKNLQIEKIYSSFSSGFLNIDSYNIDKGITDSLKEIAKLISCDDAVLITSNREQNTFHRKYSFFSERDFSNNPEDISTEDLAWWTGKMENGELICLNERRDLPDTAVRERVFLESRNIEGLLCVPFFFNNELAGFICLSRRDKSPGWNNSDIRLLELAGNLFFTAIKKIEENEKNRKLETFLYQSQRLESIGMLAGGVAHDFNNIMQATIGYSDLLLRKMASPGFRISDAEKYLKNINKAGHKAADITRQLLAFSKNQEITPEVLCINKKINDLYDMLKRLIGENIEIALELDENLWNTEIDPTHLDQVITNICINAKDALKDTGRGKILIRTGNIRIDYEKKKNPEIIQSGNYVLITINDNGRGIDNKILPRIFDPFFSTKGEKGTGLGLSTVYGIVKQNNGYIEAESIQDKGTSFKIYFRRSDDAVPEETLYSPSCNNRDNKCHSILLVEDDENLIELMYEMLDDSGHTVKTAKSGEEALEQMQKPGPDTDLLITDIVLPDINGKELKERISLINPGIKTIYMSGYNQNIISSSSSHEKNTAFMEKPFSRETLESRIEELFL